MAKRMAKKRTLCIKVTPLRLMKAIKGSAGIKRRIADTLNCTYDTVLAALKREGDDWEMCRQAYQAEVETVGDVAEMTVHDTMSQRLDLSVASTTARWYLDRKHTDRGFGKKDQVTLEGGQNPLTLQHQTVIPIDKLDLPLEVKKQILEAMDKLAAEEQGG